MCDDCIQGTSTPFPVPTGVKFCSVVSGACTRPQIQRWINSPIDIMNFNWWPLVPKQPWSLVVPGFPEGVNHDHDRSRRVPRPAVCSAPRSAVFQIIECEQGFIRTFSKRYTLGEPQKLPVVAQRRYSTVLYDLHYSTIVEAPPKYYCGPIRIGWFFWLLIV
jgi:hypothetical protein